MKLPKFLNDLFSPSHLQNLSMDDIASALANPSIRKIWLLELFEEMKSVNLEVDKRLLAGGDHMKDLAIRRKAYQDILEKVALAKRRVQSQTPQSEGFDLDSVTVEPV